MAAPTSWSGCAGSARRLPGLIDFLKRQHRNYDAVVFFSLYHATTVQGIAVAPERSVLFPHLQLDPALRFGLWRELLGSVRAVGYASAAERRLARRRSCECSTRRGSRRHRRRHAAAADVSAPPAGSGRHAFARTTTNADAERAEAPEYLAGRGVPFRRRHRLYGSFALYGGRVEPDNGCEEMLEYFDSYVATDGDTVARADGRQDDEGAGRAVHPHAPASCPIASG